MPATLARQSGIPRSRYVRFTATDAALDVLRRNQEVNTVVNRLLVPALVMLPMLFRATSCATVIPTPPYPGASPSLAYRVAVDGQPIFTYRYPTYNQFNWMDYARFSMTGKVHVTITNLVSEREVRTCYIRPIAYNIQPQIKGNTVSFD